MIVIKSIYFHAEVKFIKIPSLGHLVRRLLFKFLESNRGKYFRVQIKRFTGFQNICL